MCEECTKEYNNPKAVSNWIMGELLRILNDRGLSMADVKFTPSNLAELLKLVEKSTISGTAAKKVFEAMCYQISKEICAMACALSGNVDAIVLTGGLAYSKMLVELVSERVKFIAQVIVIPGEDENLALAQGANRVLNGEETAKIYEDEVFVK
jgi:butyrate kinase